jgi:hypothetical protein
MSTFNYTTRDFSTIKSDLLQRASTSIPEWVNRDSSDFMMALIDLVAYSADIQHFYIDRAAAEAFLGTATQRESVLALSNLYDYTPNFIDSSRATISVYNSSTSASVVLPAGTTFSATSGGVAYSFYSTSEVAVYADSASSVDVKEGVQYSDQAVTSSSGATTSSGLGSQRFNLYHTNVVPTSLVVKVYEGVGASAVEWRQVQRLVTSAASDSVYSVYVTADGTTQLLFGNGVNGRIPPTNVEIRATYATSSGSAGNVPAGAITTLSSSSYQGLRVNQPTPAAIGGIDAENIDSLKSALPRAFRTSTRAVTLSDFSDLALSVQGVSKAVTAYSVSGTGGSVSAYVVPYQSSYSTASSVSTISVDANTRDRVYNTLISNAMLGVASIGVPATISLTPVYTAVEVHVKDNYVASWVGTSVVDAITAEFEFEKVSFGQVMTIGDFYRVVLGVDGVDYAIFTNFNTTGSTNTVLANGKITINQYKLPRNGLVEVTVIGGVTAPA